MLVYMTRSLGARDRASIADKTNQPVPTNLREGQTVTVDDAVARELVQLGVATEDKADG